MKLLIQRVSNASVTIENQLYSSIQRGILAFIGIEKNDTLEQIEKLAKKVVNLRIFPDKDGKMNLSLLDIKGEILIVSQFTLCGNCKKGTRPSFDNSANPTIANEYYEKFVEQVKTYGIITKTGKFAADMKVELLNDGPVTFMLEI